MISSGIAAMLASCSYVHTDGQKSTAMNLGGRGNVQAPGVTTAYNNDVSFVALVKAAHDAIQAAIIADTVKSVTDNHYDHLDTDTAAEVQHASTKSQERVELRTLSEETKRLQITTE